jgi:hypothetical protein
MLNAQFKPLEQWPGERNKNRKNATFRVTYPKTLDELENELSKIRAKEIIIQVEGLTRDDIRNDGWPRSGTWKNGYGGPGVIVSFESPKGAMSFPCDKFRDWQDNLRAIAKSLEALRMVDRYGVTRGNEQYRGWTQIGNGNGKMDRASAFRFIETLTGAPIKLPATVETIAAIIKTLKVAHHPDKPGGSHETFVAIGQAEEVLCS